jgi:hypothetical protein
MLFRGRLQLQPQLACFDMLKWAQVLLIAVSPGDVVMFFCAFPPPFVVELNHFPIKHAKSGKVLPDFVSQGAIPHFDGSVHTMAKGHLLV